MDGCLFLGWQQSASLLTLSWYASGKTLHCAVCVVQFEHAHLVSVIVSSVVQEGHDISSQRRDVELKHVSVYISVNLQYSSLAVSAWCFGVPRYLPGNASLQ